MIGVMFACLELLRDRLPAAAIRMVEIGPGETLFHQGQTPEALFALEQGRIDLMRWTAAGSVVRIHSAKPGETFAEASLFSDAYHCDAVAVEASKLFRFGAQAVLDACDQTPELSRSFMAHLATSLRDTRHLLEIRSIQPLSDRLLTRLQELVPQSGMLPASSRIKDIAGEIGATPEATYRALRQLEDRGDVVRWQKGRVRIARSQ